MFFKRSIEIDYLWYFFLFLFISFTLFNENLYRIGGGHDLEFHLMRIEGLAEGLRGGQFPVKIQPAWYQGYGYGCSVFYGDIFLYVPALLRVFGVSLQNAYKFYVLLIHLGTIGISMYSFQGIFKQDKIALFGTTLYALSYYRLMNIYVRSAVGEYTAMMFLPLIVYALVLILNNESKIHELKKGCLLLTLGMSGILQSHILSAEMVCIVLGILCVVLIKRVLQKKVFLSLFLSVVFTFLLNLGFLIPFFDYMLTGKFNVNAINGGWRVEQNIQKQGIAFGQLGKVFYDINQELYIGVGFSLLIALMGFIYLLFKLNKEEKTQFLWKKTIVFFVVALATLWMSTCFFPWEMIRKSNVLIRYLVINLQFPWRFLTIATVSLVLLWCSIGTWKLENNRYILHIVIFMSFLTAGSLMLNVVKEGHAFQAVFANKESTMVKSGEEYLPVNANSQEFNEKNLYIDDQIQIKNWKKEGIRIQFSCYNDSMNESVIELPLLYYKGYVAKAKSKELERQNLVVTSGNNQVVSIRIPGKFQGDVIVDFQEPWYWRMAETITVLTIMALGIWCVRTRKSRKDRKRYYGKNCSVDSML